jgi:hypothetical protein
MTHLVLALAALPTVGGAGLQSLSWALMIVGFGSLGAILRCLRAASAHAS